MNMTELLIIEDRFFYERVGLTITWRERLIVISHRQRIFASANITAVASRLGHLGANLLCGLTPAAMFCRRFATQETTLGIACVFTAHCRAATLVFKHRPAETGSTVAGAVRMRRSVAGRWETLVLL